jgi:F0F1-type ATP synthase membrane subunit a
MAVTTMLRLRSRQRTVLSETFRELGNIVAGALVLGRFVGTQPISSLLVTLGVLLWLVFVGFAVLLEGGAEHG